MNKQKSKGGRLINMNTRKNLLTTKFFLSTTMAILLLAPILIPSGVVKGIEPLTSVGQTNKNDDKVFDTLSSNITNSDGSNITKNNLNTHNIVLKEELLPDGEPAYKMVQHLIDGGNGTRLNVTSSYSPLATIPGPAIVINEGDSAHVIINHLDGNTTRENFVASNPGTFVYQDDELGDRGLYGVVIVNPQDKMIEALVNGKITSISLNELDKEVLLFMVGSAFWGLEIGSNGTQTPLWTNPVPVAEEDQKIRFHVVGIGPSSNPNGHSHTFHLHAHRWVDPGTSNIIDVKEIHPGTSHVFVVDAGDGVGPGDWQFHCHVFSHMEAGMMSTFKVLPAKASQENISSENRSGEQKSIPGASPYKNFASFSISDEPGKWFANLKGDISNTGSESLAVINKSGTVYFMMDSTNGVHTVSSIIHPKNASNMPFSQMMAYKGGAIVKLVEPGLYVFACSLHPFMLAAVIVDDPDTEGLDLGEELTLVNGATIPTNSELALKLLRTFFVATSPSNWQDYTNVSQPWYVSYPNVDARVTNGTVVNVKDVLEDTFGQNITLTPLSNPSIPAVGEIWIDTQFEKTAGKTKPGTATAINGTTWKVSKKVSLPEINMNNPHNMWTDKNQDLIYQTQWFDNRTTIFDRTTGKLVKDVQVGDDPSHVMTGTKTDELYIALNGEDGVTVVSPNPEFNLTDFILLQPPASPSTHPHGHWMSSDDRYMVTPDALTGTTTIYDMMQDKIIGKVKTGVSPVAVGMIPDGSKSYVADFFDSTLSVINTTNASLIKQIDLLANYDPITGNTTGPTGFLPIQTPVSPDGQYMVTANTGGTITILDTETDQIVKELPCDPGCHGVNFGAKKGGGYYAYVSSTFSNEAIVVDGDPNNDGNPTDAMIAGKVLLVASNDTKTDDKISGLEGTGGQGVLAIPNVYNGWVQNLPDHWKSLLTEKQQNPLSAEG
ncbi:multicopper oxidase domain-containing protein [Candidatus Nitrosocosmicus franklandus]|uniref:multicopper oxidase domain-containing protein n=1 Tax=Candidatus Nitrosocosmicus franklandianus TaxID=1798806 RepID=UPI0018D587E6|nr:multicopper oxidase domain-containing protein [Candidatus Nitrosocosmicus franklandus]